MKAWTIIAVFVLCEIVAAGSPPQDAAHPAGVIAGRVVDDDGRPMRNVEVQALVSKTTQKEPRQFVPRGNGARTNDRGEFRLFWLEPGMYYVVINPNPLPDVTVQRAPYRSGVGYIPSDPDATFVITYFPGSPDVSKAQPIQVGSGEVDVQAIQVAALPSRSLRIRVLSPVETYFRPIVALRPLMDSSSMLSFIQPNQLGPEQLELRAGLTPGEYRVLLILATPNRPLVGGKTVTIDRADPDIIEIPVFPTISVQGQILSDRTIPSLTVLAIPDPSLESGTPVLAEVRPNGKFVFETIAPGRYTIQVDGLPNGATLADLKLQGETVPFENVKFPKDVESMNLVLTIKQ